MLRADRQSLVDEVDSLHHRLLEAKEALQESRDQLNQRINSLEEAKQAAEWKMQRQGECGGHDSDSVAETCQDVPKHFFRDC